MRGGVAHELPRRCTRPCRRNVIARNEAAKPKVNLFQKLSQVFKEKASSDLDRVFKGTEATRARLSVVDELLTYWSIDAADDLLEELEDGLICADFGPKTALKVVEAIRKDVLAGKLKSGEDIRRGIRDSIIQTLRERGGDSALKLPGTGTAVILVVGVNGAGKTTTLGKLSHQFAQGGARVMLGSGDTFRAAAVEQLAVWGERSGVTMGPYKVGERPEQVLSNAVAAAQEAGCDVLLCDTSGRLHTNWELMEELTAVEAAIGKRLPGAPHEVLLVLDGSTGLNMLNQAREFSDTCKVTGIVLTKLDGSARGGAVVSVVDELGIPVKFVGVGEGIEDLRPFDPDSFVSALFPAAEGAPSAREIEDLVL